ncbi:MAG: LytTR family DNA-binding domain-containing protein [Bacteroidales bacterium]|nr:LytTR family DNA-binding domain-containing protein [Bacteroidales bacterium]MCF8334837.1 LytTR family DNA-binding domain-containing protein [Bacteroidales bacterium]
MKRIRTIIVDDEKPAREQINYYLKSDERFEVIESCQDGFEALKSIQSHHPDLVFLDIQMPKLTGFEMLELIQDPPSIVFSTAYDEYALKAFEVHAVDYLLKPFTKVRFNDTLNRVCERIELQEKKEDVAEVKASYDNYTGENLQRIVVKHNGRIIIVSVRDIIFLESMDDYVGIHTSTQRYLKQKPMKYFESNLDSNQFVRIHRSYMVNLDFVSRIEPYGKETWKVILSNDTPLSVSRSGMKRLNQLMDINA